MALTIDKDTCIGCGVCSSMLEDVFVMDDNEGIAIIKDAKAGSDDQIQETIDACPVGAISL